MLARLMRGERVIHLADARTDDSYRKLPPQVQRVFEVSGIRTLLVVPLRKDDAVLGFITAFRQEIRPFSDKQIALLQSPQPPPIDALLATLLDELNALNALPGDLVLVLDDYHVITDPQIDAAVLRQPGVPREDEPLHIQGTAHRFDHTAEFDESPVTGMFDDAAAVLADLWRDDLAPISQEAEMGALLVGAHQARITDGESSCAGLLPYLGAICHCPARSNARSSARR